MKIKQFLIFLCVICMLVFFTACSSDESPLTLGMTYDEVATMTENGEAFQYMLYAFAQDEDGQSVVAQFDAEGKEIIEVKTFPAVTEYAENVDKINVGMSVYEVVELLGLPTRTATSGISSLDFGTEADGEYRVQWDSEMKVIGIAEVTKD